MICVDCVENNDYLMLLDYWRVDLCVATHDFQTFNDIKNLETVTLTSPSVCLSEFSILVGEAFFGVSNDPGMLWISNVNIRNFLALMSLLLFRINYYKDGHLGVRKFMALN